MSLVPTRAITTFRPMKTVYPVVHSNRVNG